MFDVDVSFLKRLLKSMLNLLLFKDVSMYMHHSTNWTISSPGRVITGMLILLNFGERLIMNEICILYRPPSACLAL